MKHNLDDLQRTIDLLRYTISNNSTDRYKVWSIASDVVDMYDSVFAKVCGTPIEIWIKYYEQLRVEKRYEESDNLRAWLHYEGLNLKITPGGVDYDFTARPIEKTIDKILRDKDFIEKKHSIENI